MQRDKLAGRIGTWLRDWAAGRMFEPGHHLADRIEFTRTHPDDYGVMRGRAMSKGQPGILVWLGLLMLGVLGILGVLGVGARVIVGLARLAGG